eukprot:gene5852-4175_t
MDESAAPRSSYPGPSTGSTRPQQGWRSTASSSLHQRGQRRNVFRRGDADRIFREAFGGKTLDQVMFDMRRKQQGEKKGQQAPDRANEREEDNLRLAMAHAAERYVARLQQRYGRQVASKARLMKRDWAQSMEWAVAEQLRQQRMTSAEGASKEGAEVDLDSLWRTACRGPAPAGRIPFRPFPNMRLPPEVEVPPTPTLGPCVPAAELERNAGEAAQESSTSGSDTKRNAVRDGVLITTRSRREAYEALKQRGMPSPSPLLPSASQARHTTTTTSSSAPEAKEPLAPTNEEEEAEAAHRTALEPVWEAEEAAERFRTSQLRLNRSGRVLEAYRQSRLSKSKAEDRTNIDSIPYNMGQLYSYHRPY